MSNTQTSDMLMMLEKRLSAIEQENIELKKKLEDNSFEIYRFRIGYGFWYSIFGYCNKHNLGEISAQKSAQIERKAIALCRELDITPEKIDDPRFGSINVYPEWVLDDFLVD